MVYKLGYAVARDPYTSTETWIKLEIERWKELGYDVTILNTKEGFNLNKARDLNFIIAHFVPNAARIMRLGVPFIVIPHAHDIWRDNGKWLSIVAKNKNCIGVGYISQYHKSKYEEWDIKQELIYTPVSVRINLFKRSKPLGDWILAGGRHIPKKGLDIAIKAINNIHIFGEGPLTNYLKSLSNTAIFHGYVSDHKLKELYENSWCYLFTGIRTPDGDMDGQPTTIKEAMLMKLQIVTTPIAGIPELKYIHLVNPDPKEIRDKIESLDHKPNKQGSEFIKNNFNVDCFIKNIKSIIDSYD